jgi:hypothetical protein
MSSRDEVGGVNLQRKADAFLCRHEVWVEGCEKSLPGVFVLFPKSLLDTSLKMAHEEKQSAQPEKSRKTFSLSF